MLTPFDPETHLATIQAWARARGVDYPAEILPRIGFMYGNVAVGWLYQTDSSLGLLESFVTNPKAPGRERHRAIEAIGKALLAEARGLGLRRVVTMTEHRSLGRLMVRHGFTYSGPMHVLAVEV